MEEVLRELAPQVLRALVRRYGDFAACEDAVQEALITAAQQWGAHGVPEHPRGWLVTVAMRGRTQLWRSETSASATEEAAAALTTREHEPVPDATVAQRISRGRADDRAASRRPARSGPDGATSPSPRSSRSAFPSSAISPGEHAPIPTSA